jgi:hypothetical protein
LIFKSRRNYPKALLSEGSDKWTEAVKKSWRASDVTKETKAYRLRMPSYPMD